MQFSRTLLAGLLACLAGTAAAAPGTADLRQALRQYHSAATPAPTRQLSAAERAELRRQLAELAARQRERAKAPSSPATRNPRTPRP